MGRSFRRDDFDDEMDFETSKERFNKRKHEKRHSHRHVDDEMNSANTNFVFVSEKYK